MADRPRAAPLSSVTSVTFDRRSAVPLYRQLKFHLVHAISTGRIAPGAALPSVRTVSRELKIASATVQRAYAELQAEGLAAGEQGRGVFASGLDDRAPADDGDRDELLRDVLLAPVRQAQALGFGETEIAATVRSLVERAEGSGAPRIVFVGRSPDAIDKYVPLLRGALDDVVDVRGIEVSALRESRGAVLDELAPVSLLVSLVSNFADVRGEGHQRGIEVYGLTVELSAATKRTLVMMPADARIGLVAETPFLSNTRAMVEQIRGHQAEVTWVSSDEGLEAVRAALGDRQVVLHTFGLRALAREAAPSDAELVELMFLPMEASLIHLAEVAASMAQRPTHE